MIILGEVRGDRNGRLQMAISVFFILGEKNKVFSFLNNFFILKVILMKFGVN